MTNLVLIGMMASGKSTVGRQLAQALGRPFIDTDELVAARAGCTVAELFARQGEGAFRDVESAVIHEVAGRQGLVIATGGGAVLRADNREILRQTGIVFWLDVPVAHLYARAVAQGVAGRPLLAGEEPEARLAALATSRADAYAQACHHRIDAGGMEPEAVTAVILAIVKANKGDVGNAAGTR